MLYNECIRNTYPIRMVFSRINSRSVRSIVLYISLSRTLDGCLSDSKYLSFSLKVISHRTMTTSMAEWYVWPSEKVFVSSAFAHCTRMRILNIQSKISITVTSIRNSVIRHCGSKYTVRIKPSGFFVRHKHGTHTHKHISKRTHTCSYMAQALALSHSFRKTADTWAHSHSTSSSTFATPIHLVCRFGIE